MPNHESWDWGEEYDTLRPRRERSDPLQGAYDRLMEAVRELAYASRCYDDTLRDRTHELYDTGEPGCTNADA